MAAIQREDQGTIIKRDALATGKTVRNVCFMMAAGLVGHGYIRKNNAKSQLQVVVRNNRIWTLVFFYIGIFALGIVLLAQIEHLDISGQKLMISAWIAAGLMMVVLVAMSFY